MSKIKIKEISEQIGVTHSAVSQWFSGATKPTADKMFLIEDIFKIPVSVWRDIKSYLKNDTKTSTSKSTTTPTKKAS